MTNLKTRIRALEQGRAKKAGPGWRFVYLCTEDNSWSVSDKNGLVGGKGEPYPEILPGDYVIRSNIPSDAF